MEVEVVIYFDEAHTLTEVLEYERQESLYDIFYWVTAFCHTEPVFFIFLSTEPSLAKFPASEDEANSARIARKSIDLNIPITETPFDCYPGTVGKGQLLLKDITSVMFLARFGRPL